VVTMKNAILWMLHCVALVRTDFTEECITSIIRVTGISELGTMLAVTSNRSMLRRSLNVFSLSDPSSHTRLWDVLSL
jgi:hypothetical protein